MFDRKHGVGGWWKSFFLKYAPKSATMCVLKIPVKFWKFSLASCCCYCRGKIRRTWRQIPGSVDLKKHFSEFAHACTCTKINVTSRDSPNPHPRLPSTFYHMKGVKCTRDVYRVGFMPFGSRAACKKAKTKFKKHIFWERFYMPRCVNWR